MSARALVWVPAALLVGAASVFAGGLGGTHTPPIPRAGGPSGASTLAPAQATLRGPPSLPLTSPAHGRHVGGELVRVALEPGRRTLVIAGPRALEPGSVLLDVTRSNEGPIVELFVYVATSAPSHAPGAVLVVTL